MDMKVEEIREQESRSGQKVPRPLRVGKFVACYTCEGQQMQERKTGVVGRDRKLCE